MKRPTTKRSPAITELSTDNLRRITGGGIATSPSTTQDVTVNKAKTQDKMFGKWDEYIRDET